MYSKLYARNKKAVTTFHHNRLIFTCGAKRGNIEPADRRFGVFGEGDRAVGVMMEQW